MNKLSTNNLDMLIATNGRLLIVVSKVEVNGHSLPVKGWVFLIVKHHIYHSQRFGDLLYLPLQDKIL